MTAQTTSIPCISFLAVLILGIVAIAWAPDARSSSRSSDAPATGFLDRTMNVDGVTRRYQVYVPFAWTRDKKWPVILFLHGAGERGLDGLLQTQVGIGSAIRLQATSWPFIVVMPQCEPGGWWTNPATEALALKALDHAMAEFNGDEHRVYLTGVSMGGFATWSIAGKLPQKFAAIAPVCGGVRGATLERYAEAARKVKNVPAWIFHGESDPTVPVSESRKMNDALKSLGADVRYTEYPGLGHNSWDNAYAEPDLPGWLLTHTTK